ncbi:MULTISPECIES: REP-associated tyrosine transposase [Pseudomonas]|uniref:Transposase n=1 Tax=Pseudomonas idahonensis TaxID=2942628 RepID=A0ABT5Q5F7_9PSED|nr:MULTISPECIES: transposase [Pseudomonas]MDD1149412.1 transposase [Pseudomonas idahonensis]MDF2399312.1 transposase [Pseudomonas sp. 3MA1]MDP4568516.1 transposase [Pseudomonas sp. LPH60]MDP9505927.1 transposase [Pseudomonas protegens]MDP9512775.1 transposase [Pseudomonas protegens]
MQFRSNGYRLLKGRHTQIGRIYAITAVTEQRRPMFSDFYLGRLVVEQIRAQHEAGLIHSLAWVVMPDHIHWLFQLQKCSLEESLCRLKSRSGRNINQRLNQRGRLWQKGYYERAIRREADLKALARYIIYNPVRAGLVQRVGDYPLWDAAWL